eukprot:761837-Hanusia_phi.AAC.3
MVGSGREAGQGAGAGEEEEDLSSSAESFPEQPKKGGKRLADLGDGQEGATKGAKFAARTEFERGSEMSKVYGLRCFQQVAAKTEESTAAVTDTLTQQVPRVTLSSRQRNAIQAWDRYQKEVEKHFGSLFRVSAEEEHCGDVEEPFQGVECDVKSVTKNLQVSASCCSSEIDRDARVQDNLQSAKGVERNVKTARTYLSHISQALESIDTLVVPIVLQKNGNF